MSTKESSQNTSLKLSKPHLLAEAIRLPEFKGFLEQNYVAPPDHAAILIRDGQIVDTFQGANFSIGGMFGKLKSLFVGQNHVRVVLADLRPFSLQTPFKALTKDSVEVAAVATLELQIDPERAANAMGLVGPTDSVGRQEILDRFRPHLDGRIIQTVIARVNADEVRTELGLQEKIQADVMREVERLAGNLGLIVRAVSLEWAINAVERQAMERSELDREEVRLDEALQDLKRGIERNSDATTFQLTTDVDFAKLEMASESELTRLALENEIRLVDFRVATDRKREMETLEHEVKALVSERVATFANEIANVEHAIDFARHQATLAKLHREAKVLDTEMEVRLRKLNVETEQDLARRGSKLDLEGTIDAQRAGRDNIAGLAEIDRNGQSHAVGLRISEADAAAKRERERLEAESRSRIEQMKLAASMTPQQILAVNAGFSPEVAAVMAEQARAGGQGNKESMELMREMVDRATDARISSEAQAREMFSSAMDGVKGVAAGAGGGRVEGASKGATSDKTECGQCGRSNGLTHKFCIGCGNKLRV